MKNTRTSQDPPAISGGLHWRIYADRPDGSGVFRLLREERAAAPSLAASAPLAVPAFVNGYAWVSLTHAVEGYLGAVLIVSLSYFPFIYLPVTASLMRIDPEFEDTAHTLGLSGWATFGRVVLPQLRPALLGGSLLVALHLLAEFGALQMLRYQTFTTAIYDQFGTTFNGPSANLTAARQAGLSQVTLLEEPQAAFYSWLAQTGESLRQVDVISHSEGYLLTRAYVSSTLYNGTYTDAAGSMARAVCSRRRSWATIAWTDSCRYTGRLGPSLGS